MLWTREHHGRKTFFHTRVTFPAVAGNFPKFQEERASHRTLILRVERTDGLNGASSFPAGLFGGALLAESKACLRLSSAALLFAGTGLNMEVRL